MRKWEQKDLKNICIELLFRSMELKNGSYFIGDVNVEELCEKYGTPLYVYDLQSVREQAAKFRDAIKCSHKRLLYAIKINFNPQVVLETKAQGYGIDAVSLEEILYALKLGFEPEEILYTGNNITDEEMRRAHELGVMLNVGALSRLEKYGREFPGSRVCVRINPKVVAETHAHWITGGPLAKFGINYDECEEAREIAAKYDLKIVGVHEHVGTSILDPQNMLDAMDMLLAVAGGFPDLEFINFGGGIGLAYKPEDKEIDIEDFGRAASEKFEKFCERYGKQLTFMMEPGRYLVGHSGHLFAEVNTLKTRHEGRTFAGLNTGYHHLIRPMTYGSYHPIRNVSNPEGEMRKYDVAGNICESGDLFARDRMIEEIREGDLLCVEMAGASGFVMANHYHLRPLPPEIVVDGGRIVVSRERESLEDIIKAYNL